VSLEVKANFSWWSWTFAPHTSLDFRRQVRFVLLTLMQTRRLFSLAGCLTPSCTEGERQGDNGVGLTVPKLDAKQCPKWKDTPDHNLAYKTYCSQWRAIEVWEKVLHHHWDSPVDSPGCSYTPSKVYRERCSGHTRQRTIGKTSRCHQDFGQGRNVLLLTIG
jgi:hypothetical protein